MNPTVRAAILAAAIAISSGSVANAALSPQELLLVQELLASGDVSQLAEFLDSLPSEALSGGGVIESALREVSSAIDDAEAAGTDLSQVSLGSIAESSNAATALTVAYVASGVVDEQEIADNLASIGDNIDTPETLVAAVELVEQFSGASIY